MKRNRDGSRHMLALPSCKEARISSQPLFKSKQEAEADALELCKNLIDAKELKSEIGELNRLIKKIQI